MGSGSSDVLGLLLRRSLRTFPLWTGVLREGRLNIIYWILYLTEWSKLSRFRWQNPHNLWLTQHLLQDLLVKDEICLKFHIRQACSTHDSIHHPYFLWQILQQGYVSKKQSLSLIWQLGRKVVKCSRLVPGISGWKSRQCLINCIQTKAPYLFSI